ncbi:MotA/TolQ/ExbB proton channel family protein [Colwellia echini]|uniref:MotA/TolQ/ExbB proton channel family protein n=2 Tax=Colwellia echini TaxID=1982103 RepID=A0ABY3N0D6_9GAMM|nr:MotA/TolQ/ExbB proton channel family protein [Colwellia echini]
MIVAFGSALGVTAINAQASDSLQALYQQVKNDVSTEAAHNSEREQRFMAAAGEQKAMLAEVEAAVAAQEAMRDEMKVSFDDNEAVLEKVSTQLDRRTGNLGELFGVFRQMAGDTQQMLYSSIITSEFPERTAEIEVLSQTKEVPTIAEMQKLWALMLQEISESGQVSRFNTEVTKPSGESYNAEVTRVGTFNAITADKYLNYDADGGQLVELSRQPASNITNSAAELSASSGNKETSFAVDPSRGVLLGLLVQSPSLIERVQQGKGVGYAILALGVIGLLIVLERMTKLSIISKRMNKQLKNMNQASDDNPLGRMMLAYYENKHLNDLDVISKKLQEVIFKDLAEIRKGLATIKVLAAIAPLMGLLGTVTGMIGTFQAITLFGTGDPKLMAGGISQALITTVEGLIVAIPLLLCSNMLSSRTQQLSKVIGEQASGMVAQKAVEIASAKA